MPRKGGPGITQSDLLVINKTDLAEAVGADLKVKDSHMYVHVSCGAIPPLSPPQRHRGRGREQSGQGIMERGKRTNLPRDPTHSPFLYIHCSRLLFNLAPPSLP